MIIGERRLTRRPELREGRSSHESFEGFAIKTVRPIFVMVSIQRWRSLGRTKHKEKSPNMLLPLIMFAFTFFPGKILSDSRQDAKQNSLPWQEADRYFLGSSKDLNDLKSFKTFKIKGRYKEIENVWGKGFFNESGDAAAHKSSLQYRSGNTLISFEGGEMSGRDGYFTFRLKMGADRNVPVVPIKGSIAIAGLGLGMDEKVFKVRMALLARNMQGYHVKKEKEDSNSFFRWYEKPLTGGCTDYLTVEGKFREGKLVELKVHELGAC